MGQLNTRKRRGTARVHLSPRLDTREPSMAAPTCQGTQTNSRTFHECYNSSFQTLAGFHSSSPPLGPGSRSGTLEAPRPLDTCPPPSQCPFLAAARSYLKKQSISFEDQMWLWVLQQMLTEHNPWEQKADRALTRPVPQSLSLLSTGRTSTL